MSAALTAPVLEASELRVAVDGRVVLEGLDLRTSGPKIALVGDVGALLSLLTNVPLGAASRALSASPEAGDSEGIATVASGTFRFLGADVAEAEHSTLVGSVPLDPPLPGDITASEYVVWSARLAGLGRAAASSAQDALERVGLGKAAKRLLATLSLPERRALLFAHALVGSPRAIVADNPLADLEGAAAAFVLAAFEAATEDRSVVVSMSRTTPGTPEGQIAAQSSDLVFISRGELVLAGPPAQIVSTTRLYGLTVRSNAEALRNELLLRGIELRGGPLRFSASLPEGRDTRDILAAAVAARSAVVELLSVM